MIVDLRKALTAAVRAVVGADDVTVSICWFHDSQALIKHLKKLVFTDAYANEETTHVVVVRSLLALPLPPHISKWC